MRFLYLILAFAVLAASTFSTTAQAQELLSKSDVEKIVKNYLMENPETLIESLEAFREKQERSEKASAQENIQNNLKYLQSADAPSIGPANADVVVVEFFDYNCGYCRRAVPDIQKVTATDDNVRFVFREMPILSPNSREVALWSLASHKQDKYFEFHAALMDQRGTRSGDTMKKLAKKLGMDPDQLEKDAKSDAVKAMLDKDLDLARSIGIRGTPAFIINGELYPGYLGEEGLQKAIESARDK